MGGEYVCIEAKFESSELRDKAIEFLNDEGPAFEDEVEEPYRKLFILNDKVDVPDDLETIGDNGLKLVYDPVDAGEIIVKFMKCFYSAGAFDIQGIVSDPGEILYTLDYYGNLREKIIE